MDEERGIALFYHRLVARRNRIGWVRGDETIQRRALMAGEGS